MKDFTAVAVIVFCLLAINVCPGTSNHLSLNDYGEDFEFECDSNECLNHINTYIVENTTLNLTDLQWELGCNKIEGYGKQFCDDYTTVNDPRADLILFQCPHNAYVAGLNSIFIGNNTFADRMWEVRCCRTLGLCTRNCYLYPFSTRPYLYLNDGQVVINFFSTYNGGDLRNYYFTICTLEDCGSPKVLKYIHHPWSK